MNIIKFNGPVITGEMDIDSVKMICVPSKPHYADVDLCFKDDWNIQIGEISGKSLSFEDRIKIGKEIEKRWNAYNPTDVRNIQTPDAAERLNTTANAIRQYCRNHDDIGEKSGKVYLLSEDDLIKIEKLRAARWSKKGE